MRHEIVPIWAAALLGSLVPIVVILICQIRIRSFWDVNNAVIGLLYSLITAAFPDGLPTQYPCDNSRRNWQRPQTNYVRQDHLYR
jgi:hypothetical protein